MMFDYEKLNERYEKDGPFNRLVNVFKKAIEEFGFLPDELRQAAFLAQMHIQLYKAEKIIQSEKEWQNLEEARKILQKSFVDIKQLLRDDDEKT
jgi:hypothetical protein